MTELKPVMRIKIGNKETVVHAGVVGDAVRIHYTEPHPLGQTDTHFGTDSMEPAGSERTSHAESLEILRMVVENNPPGLKGVHKARILREIAEQQKKVGRPVRRIAVVQLI